jgi:hypothetical protein
VATRTLSRHALRDQHDQAQPPEPDDTPNAEGDDAGKPAKKPRAKKVAKPAKDKAPAKSRVRKKAVKVPPRMFARWAVCDGGMKRVAEFEYRDRAGADTKLAEVRERKSGAFFLLLVKDPDDPPTPADPAAVV